MKGKLNFSLKVNNDSPKSLLTFKEKFNLPFTFLSDSDKKVSKLFGADGIFFPKRITFLVGPDGIVKKIYDKINVNTHANEILNDITKKN